MYVIAIYVMDWCGLGVDVLKYSAQIRIPAHSGISALIIIVMFQHRTAEYHQF
jgi:hypothetical protein